MKLKFFLFFFLFIIYSQHIYAEAIPVKLDKTSNGKYQLYRNNKSYFIKGAGGDASIHLLMEAGANSFRTWGVDEYLLKKLDEAHDLGLSVAVGHWLGHERHGFDYNDASALDEQFLQIKNDVIRYKDHPAVLLWGIGNEMEGFEEGDNIKIWKHVNEIAKMIKEIDPNHLTMTVIAEIGGKRIEYFHKYCPDVDIVGINTYGGLLSLNERYTEQGGDKPYIITEFGPPGTWESPKTDFGTPLELTSTEKAEFYRKAYIQGCLTTNKLCLGSYAFNWGSKIEGSSTWYGMFLYSGEKLSSVDVMTEMWTGEKTENLCPRINQIDLKNQRTIQTGKEIHIELEVTDPENDNIQTEWIICSEPTEYLIASETQWIPLPIKDMILSSSEDGAKLKINSAGIYRIYVTALDGKGGAATANIPIQVLGEKTEIHYKLPLYVYSDNHPQPWFYSGWMGNYKELQVDADYTSDPYVGETCMKICYNGLYDWGGIAWQHPANDWGEREGGYNLSGSKKLTFWAKGEFGGEDVDFGIGILGKDKKYHDTANANLKNITLKSSWNQYSIKLKGKNLSRIKTPFYFTITGDTSKITVYLDDIRFE